MALSLSEICLVGLLMCFAAILHGCGSSASQPHPRKHPGVNQALCNITDYSFSCITEDHDKAWCEAQRKSTKCADTPGPNAVCTKDESASFECSAGKERGTKEWAFCISEQWQCQNTFGSTNIFSCIVDDAENYTSDSQFNCSTKEAPIDGWCSEKLFTTSCKSHRGPMAMCEHGCFECESSCSDADAAQQFSDESAKLCNQNFADVQEKFSCAYLYGLKPVSVGNKIINTFYDFTCFAKSRDWCENRRFQYPDCQYSPSAIVYNTTCINGVFHCQMPEELCQAVKPNCVNSLSLITDLAV